MFGHRAVLLSRVGLRVKRIGAVVTILTFIMQDFAWAVCADGSTFPFGGFSPATGTNWLPNVFTGTLGSVWVPDVSKNERNDPQLPLTLGGHDWVFDQGASTCRITDVGSANQPPKGWTIPPVNTTDCVILPVIKGGRITNVGDLPQRSTALTPTCDPSILQSRANTYFNQLGCSISHGVATTPATATTFLFAAGIKGGLFSIQLTKPAIQSSAASLGRLQDRKIIMLASQRGKSLTVQRLVRMAGSYSAALHGTMLRSMPASTR